MGCGGTIDGQSGCAASVEALDWKNSVRVATTAALPANTLANNRLTANANGAFAAVDTIALALNESILVKDEGAGQGNGIYTLVDAGSAGTPWILQRRNDANSNADVTSGLTTFVEEGAVNADTVWTLITPNPIVLNTTVLTFANIMTVPVATWAAVLAAGSVSGGTSPQISDTDDLLPVTTGVPDIGSAALRFANSFINIGYFAGADPGDGVVGSADVVIGDGTGSNGITIFTDSVAGVGSYLITDIAGASIAGMTYDNSSNLLRFRAAGGDRGEFSSAAFRPVTDGGISLGTTGRRFSDMWGATLYLAGAASGNGPAGADELVIGDGAANNYGLTIFTSNVNIGNINFTDTSGTFVGRVTYNHSGDVMSLYTATSERVRASANAWSPGTAVTGLVDLGISATNRWRDLFMTGDAYIAGATVGDGIASYGDNLVIGDGTGSAGSTVFIDSVAGVGGYMFAQVAGTLRAGVRYNASSNEIQMIAGGVQLLNIRSTGMWSNAASKQLGSAATPWGDFYATTAYFGDGSGDPHITIAKGAATDNDSIYFAAAGTAAANRYWAINFDASENLNFARWAAGAEIDQPIQFSYATGDVTFATNVTSTAGDIEASGGVVKALNGLIAGDTAGFGSTSFNGSGVPGAGLGANGDFYFRSDGAAGAVPVLYHKEGGAWVVVI